MNNLMPEMHLRQPGFTNSACGPFTKSKERIKKLKKRETQDIFIKMNYQCELDKAWLVFNMIYSMDVLKI